MLIKLINKESEFDRLIRVIIISDVESLNFYPKNYECGNKVEILTQHFNFTIYFEKKKNEPVKIGLIFGIILLLIKNIKIFVYKVIIVPAASIPVEHAQKI